MKTFFVIDSVKIDLIENACQFIQSKTKKETDWNYVGGRAVMYSNASKEELIMWFPQFIPTFVKDYIGETNVFNHSESKLVAEWTKNFLENVD
jgi:lipocalin